MPRLTALLAAAAVVLAQARAAGAERATWSVDARAGYAASWSTGQPSLGFGTGLSGGVTFALPVHLEASATYYAGSVDSARNATIRYWSRQWSLFGAASAGWDARLVARRLVLRPKVVLGCVALFDTTELASSTRRGPDALLAFGPGLDALVMLGGAHGGIAGHALFVPSRVAAPIGAAQAVFGADF